MYNRKNLTYIVRFLPFTRKSVDFQDFFGFNIKNTLNTKNVDYYGSIDAIDKILCKGDMEKQRIGEMLPRDYTYIPPQMIQRGSRPTLLP